MLEELQKYMKNKAKKADLPSCEAVLGSEAAVDRFARFWIDNAGDLELVTAITLHKYEVGTDFTKEELAGFMKGLAQVGLFFRDCFNEQQQRQERIKREVAEAAMKAEAGG